MTAARASRDGARQGRRPEGPAAASGSGRGGDLGRAELHALPSAGGGALGAGAAKPSAQGAPRLRHSFAKEIKVWRRPRVRVLCTRGTRDTGEGRSAGGGARQGGGLAHHPPRGPAGSGRGHRRSDRAGTPEGAVRTACLRCEPGKVGELGASARVGTPAGLP